jgi:uncharacterized membrane protein (UPF0182 family)
VTDKLKISGTVGSRPSRFPVSRWGLALVVGAILVVVFKLADWTAELLWFRALGYEEAFWRLRIARIAMFAIAFIPVFAYVRLNLLVLARFADVRSLLGGGSPAGMSQSWPDHSGTGGAPPKTRQLTALQIFASATVATIFGFAFYGEWDRFLRWVWGPGFRHV